MKDIDKYRGCLIGGAAGDALGYMTPSLRLPTIFIMTVRSKSIVIMLTKYGKANIFIKHTLK